MTGAVRQTYQSITARAKVIDAARAIVATDGNIVFVLLTRYNPESIGNVK